MSSPKCPKCRYFSAQLWSDSKWALYYRCKQCDYGWRLMNPGFLHLRDRRHGATRLSGSAKDRKEEMRG